MSIDTLRDAIPPYAKDLSLNLSTLAGETTLTEQQKWGTFVASAYAVGQPDVVRNINTQAEGSDVSNEALTAAKAAAALAAVRASTDTSEPSAWALMLRTTSGWPTA